MRLIELVQAREALQKLVSQNLPIKTAYKLMKLTDACNFHLQFYGNEMSKINPEKDLEKLEELNSMEIDFQAEKVEIRMRDDLMLSATDVKMLLPLVDFLEEV